MNKLGISFFLVVVLWSMPGKILGEVDPLRGVDLYFKDHDFTQAGEKEKWAFENIDLVTNLILDSERGRWSRMNALNYLFSAKEKKIITSAQYLEVYARFFYLVNEKPQIFDIDTAMELINNWNWFFRNPDPNLPDAKRYRMTFEKGVTYFRELVSALNRVSPKGDFAQLLETIDMDWGRKPGQFEKMSEFLEGKSETPLLPRKILISILDALTTQRDSSMGPLKTPTQ